MGKPKDKPKVRKEGNFIVADADVFKSQEEIEQFFLTGKVPKQDSK